MKERLKQIRKSFDDTQQEFADRLGVSKGLIQSYELGRLIPTNAFIALLINKCGISEDWFRTGNGDMYQKAQIDIDLDRLRAVAESDDPIAPAVASMLHHMADLKPEQWATVIGFIRSSAEDNTQIGI